jgi:hypothetical protein
MDENKSDGSNGAPAVNLPLTLTQEQRTQIETVVNAARAGVDAALAAGAPIAVTIVAFPDGTHYSMWRGSKLEVRGLLDAAHDGLRDSLR